MTFPKRLAPAAYLVALSLVLIPLLDASMSAFPPHIHDARWRFGAVGLLINAMLFPSIGSFLAISTAAVCEHRRTQRALGVISAVVAVVCIAALVGFCLDAAQSRSGVRPELQLSFLAATGMAAFKLIVATAVFALLARAGWKAGGKAAAKVRPDTTLARFPDARLSRTRT